MYVTGPYCVNEVELLQTGSGQSSWITGGCRGCRCVRRDTETDEQSRRGQAEQDSGSQGLMASVNHPETNMWAHWGNPTRAMPQQWQRSWQMFHNSTSRAWW